MLATGMLVSLLAYLAVSAGASERGDLPIAMGDTVEITAEEVPVVVRTETIGVADIAQRYEVLRIEPPWLRIELADGKQGWIPSSRAEFVPVIEIGELVEVVANSARVLVDDRAITVAPQGTEFVVLEVDDSRLLVHTDSGDGWIAVQGVREKQREPSALAEEYRTLRDTPFEELEPIDGETNESRERRETEMRQRNEAVWARREKRIANLLRNLVDECQRTDRDVNELVPDAVGLLDTSAGRVAWEVRRSTHPERELGLRRLRISIRKRVVGTQHWQTTDARVELLVSERRQSLTDAQRHQLEEARMRFHEASLIPDLRSAIAEIESSESMIEELVGVGDPDYIDCVERRGFLYQKVGEFARARRMNERVLELRQRLLGQNHPEVARALETLAWSLRELGDHAGANQLNERATEISVLAFGDRHPESLRRLEELADARAASGEFEEAIAIFERVLVIRRESEPNPLFADGAVEHIGTKIARIIQKSGNLKGARELHERLLISKRGAAAEMPTLLDLWRLCVAEHDNQRAAEIVGRARELADQSLREPCYRVQHGYMSIVLEIMGDPKRALALRQREFECTREKRSDDDPDLASDLVHLARLTTDPSDRFEFVDDARRIVRRHVARVLPGLSPAEQLRFLHHYDGWMLESCLVLGLLHRNNDAIPARTLEWLINSKGLAVESLVVSTRVVRESRDSHVAPIVAELARTRSELARESLLVVSDDGAGLHARRLVELERQTDNLVRRLGLLGFELGSFDPWVESDSVREQIAEGAVLVEIARFRGYDPKSGWGAPTFTAWIVPAAGRGEIVIVDLGPAEPIDAAVAAVRREMASAPRRVQEVGDAVAERRLLGDLKTLANLVLEPLLAKIDDDIERLIISPDGSLWHVPWAALPMSDGRYTVERFEIQHVVSGRDLVARPGFDGTSAPPVILADPDFDLSAVGSTGVEERSGPVFRRVARLPATAAEARALEPGMRAYTGIEPVVLTGASATETAIKQLRHPAVLSLATHGFFLRDQEVRLDEDRPIGLNDDTRAAVLTTEGKPLENPLLRCGLLLVGANQRNRAGDGEDGVLTGLEILDIDLRGTKLVVLSACETGIGEIQNGEGVAGLRQAFQLAGAESVVASLWQVDDLATARLMRDFFEHLSEPGSRRAVALRKAQLDRIASRRDRYGAAHPFYWAAFTLTGSE